MDSGIESENERGKTSDKLATLMLWTPYGVMQSERLSKTILSRLSSVSEMRFLNGCYVEPEDGKPKDSAKDFSNWIIGTMVNPVYLTGFSGSGKTTYLRWLNNKFKNDKLFSTIVVNEKDVRLPIKPCFINLTDKGSKIQIGGNSWDFNGKKIDPVDKFIIALVSACNRELLMRSDENNDKLRKRLNKMLKAYNILYKNKPDDSFHKIVGIIKEYTENTDMIYESTLENEGKFYCEKLYECMVENYFDNDDRVKIIERLITLLSFINLLTLDEKTINRGTDDFRFVFFFDNIENFIRVNADVTREVIPIYDEHVGEILKGVRASIENISGSFTMTMKEKYKEWKYSRIFRLVFSVRLMTKAYVGSLPCVHGEDVERPIKDVTEWYLPARILEKRLQYYGRVDSAKKDHYTYITKEKNLLKELPEISFRISDDLVSLTERAFEAIINDTPKINKENGLSIRLSMLYSYNKRRMIYNIIELASERPDLVNDYLRIWFEKDNAGVSQIVKRALTHGARHVLLRGLLDRVKSSEFSDMVKLVLPDKPHIPQLTDCVENTANNIDYSVTGVVRDEVRDHSFTIRLLTFLYRCFPYHEFNGRDINDGDYQTLDALIWNRNGSGVLTGTSDDEINKAVSDIHMLKTADFYSHIVPLIMLKYNEKNFTKESLAEKIISKSSSKCFGLRITESGRQIIRMAADFEYFSSMYYNSSYPLFSNESYLDSSSTIEIIEGVCDKAMNMIDWQFEYDRHLVESRYNRLYSSSNGRRNDERRYLYKKYFYVDEFMAKNVLNNDGSRKYTNQGWNERHEEVFPLRIIKAHLSYLDAYRISLHWKYNEDSSFNAAPIIRALMTCMKRYLDKMKALTKIRHEDNAGTKTEYHFYIGGSRRSPTNNLDEADKNGEYYYKRFEANLLAFFDERKEKWDIEKMLSSEIVALYPDMAEPHDWEEE